MRVLRSVLYWLAVLVISVVLVVLLIMFFESRDKGGIHSKGHGHGTADVAGAGGRA
jgi:hypothetical protein